MAGGSNEPFTIDVSTRVRRLPPYLFARLNGLKAEKVTGRGHRNERGVRFTAILVPAKDATATDAVIAVGPETMYKQHMRDIDNALDTIKPAQ